MPRFLLALASLAAACGGGLRSGGDGGLIGVGCKKTVTDPYRLPDAPIATPLADVQSLLFDSQRQLYVLSPKWVNLYTPAPSHSPIKSLGKGVLKAAVDFALDTDGTLWVVDFDPDVDNTPTVRHLDADGNELLEWTTGGDVGNSILLEDRGTVLIAATRLERYERDGGFVDGHGDPADPNLIPYFSGLVKDPKGFIWAGELNENVVAEFSVDLDWLDSLGGRGSGPGMFDADDPDVHAAPNRIALDGHGDLYVNDPLASRIMKLARTGGTMLGQFSFGGSQDVGPVAIEPSTGVVYVGRGNGVDLVCPL